MDAVILDFRTVADNHDVWDVTIFVIEEDIDVIWPCGTSFSFQIICKNPIEPPHNRRMTDARLRRHEICLSFDELRDRRIQIFVIRKIFHDAALPSSVFVCSDFILTSSVSRGKTALLKKGSLSEGGF